MPPTDPDFRKVDPNVSAPQPLPTMPTPIQPGLPQTQDVPSMPASMMMKKPKRKLPIVPIAIAVTVCVLLIGAVVFVFIKSNNTTKQTPDSGMKHDDNVDKTKVTPEDIDAANSEIDKNLNNTNDSTDFKVDDLTNQTLGL